jgi:prepilin-type N-terminal cleavage/methylation domain-containing protein
MKPRCPTGQSPHRATGRRPDCGFTLPELLVAISVFAFLLIGIVTANLYGLSLFRITETKINATTEARQTMGNLANEIRSCRSTWIGNVKNGSFVARLDGEKQEGTGLLIYPTTNQANYIIYFVNPNDQTFRRTTSTPGSATVLAGSVTNAIVFRAQDHLGNVLTNNKNNRVIQFNLEFHQPARHSQVADYFKLETAVTRRALE